MAEGITLDEAALREILRSLLEGAALVKAPLAQSASLHLGASLSSEGSTASASELAALVQEWLDGELERASRTRAASEAFARAKMKLEELRALERRLEDLAERIDRERPADWTPVADKLGYWHLEEDCERTRNSVRETADDALMLLLESHSHDRDNLEIRRALAERLWLRFQEAERLEDLGQIAFYREHLARLELDEFRLRLEGTGTLILAVAPTAVRAEIRRLMPSRGRLVGGDWERYDEDKPSRAMGYWEIQLHRPGFRDIVAPVRIARNEDVVIRGHFHTEVELRPGFVQIPPGSFRMGGDPDSTGDFEWTTPYVDEFAIGRYPITWGEYVEFLRSLHSTDPELALSHMPRRNSEGEPYSWLTHPTSTIEEKYRDLPVFGVSFHDATKYSAWRSGRDGILYGLPNDEEWEKAARGVDGREFPWGRGFDPSYCCGKACSMESDRCHPVGHHERDCSPYGVRDMGGGVLEWCDGWYLGNRRSLRGGYWSGTRRAARCASRNGAPENDVSNRYGFRLCHHFEEYRS
ncbi:MAG: SUMF1/EgtB/PvdO family nonheme iron enzyme [Planctomycetes bacterium]|nr:SUMF1/EgtB/PvdO family nonheme iron enzyme [Planctomycetota bacterium]